MLFAYGFEISSAARRDGTTYSPILSGYNLQYWTGMETREPGSTSLKGGGQLAFCPHPAFILHRGT